MHNITIPFLYHPKVLQKHNGYCIFLILLFTVLSASNYIIDTPTGQFDENKVNWAYPMDICLPNQFISRGITAYVKYECKENDDNTYSVIKNSYDISDTTCVRNVIATKTFSSGTNTGLAGYFVCNQERFEYAIINVYDNDPTCTTSSISLYSAIGTSEELCFNDRKVYISLFECVYDANSLEDSYIKQTVYEDNQCTNPIIGNILTSSDCLVIGTMSLSGRNGGHTIIYGRHDSCKYNYNNQDDDSIENVLFGPNHTRQVSAIAVGFISSVVVYVGLIVFLFVNGVLCLCYLYKNKDHK
eukprot:827610_1